MPDFFKLPRFFFLLLGLAIFVHSVSRVIGFTRPEGKAAPAIHITGYAFAASGLALLYPIATEIFISHYGANRYEVGGNQLDRWEGVSPIILSVLTGLIAQAFWFPSVLRAPVASAALSFLATIAWLLPLAMSSNAAR